MTKNTTQDFIRPRFFVDVVVDAVIVIVLVLITRFFLFAPFQVHGQSMCDTFNSYNGACYSGDGEYVITSRLSTWDLAGWSPTHLERGDVVIFEAPYSQNKEYYIKRVIGLPGDALKIENGLIYLMDEDGAFVALDESYLNDENQGNTMPHRTLSETYTVPNGKVFVLGDNRLRSNDSRRCFQQTGCSGDNSPYLGLDQLEGEVKLVIFPLSHFRWVSTPGYSL